MATTTNYGWTTPDDTALVKDGAAAIRTLGTSVDTTTKALNPETTLGDLAYRSSTANVKTRLGLGTAGQILQVNSGATAPEWATPAATTPSFVGCQVFMGATMTISNNSFTAIQFANTDYLDTDAFHNPSTNNTRFTVPAGKGGKYYVFGQIIFASGGSNGNFRPRIDLNGSVFLAGRYYWSGNSDQTATIEAIITLTAGDYVEFLAYQNSGGNLDLWGTTALGGANATAFGLEYLGA
jgi:hypothetical protein